MAQRWNDLLFMHWPVAVANLRAVVPAALPLDLHDGTAWISITPFHLSHMRPRGMPPVPWLSEFLEVNVRTYVTVGGKPGVYFFSLDAGKLTPVLGARLLFHLPYHRASITLRRQADGTIDYQSRRSSGARAELEVRYAADGPVSGSQVGSLDWWLTERYCLYAVDSASRVHRAEIHHAPWPLQPARADVRVNTMATAAGIVLPAISPRLSCSKRLDVLVWPARPVA
jgi:uncharacterized protein YqjF (DUF2071 family)